MSELNLINYLFSIDVIQTTVFRLISCPCSSNGDSAPGFQVKLAACMFLLLGCDERTEIPTESCDKACHRIPIKHWRQFVS